MAKLAVVEVAPEATEVHLHFLCAWKAGGKICGGEIQDGYRFCEKHVAKCIKGGYERRAFWAAARPPLTHAWANTTH